MDRSVLLGALFLAASASAQSWCPPGATWNYDIVGMFIQGNALSSYEGDTLLDGYEAQKILRHERHLSWWVNSEVPDTINTVTWRYTAVADSVLLLRNAVGTEWDTLHVLNSTIGSRWWPAFMTAVCDQGNMGMLVVVDTGTVLFGGVALRSWTLDFVNEMDEPAGYALNFTERLGPEFGFDIHPWVCMSASLGERFRCYFDNEIATDPVNAPFDCSSMTSLPEVSVGALRPAPNPGSDQLTIPLPAGPYTVQLLDATGRVVLAERVMGPAARLSTAQLPAGPYTVRIAGHAPVRWIKQ